MDAQRSRGTESAVFRGYVITLLTASYGLNLFDRQIINVLAEAIKRDLHLTDWQLGAVTGLSFALLYSVAAIPIARWADRGNRARIIGLAILTWSVFTATCGAALNFAQLLVARIGVGIGEAGCSPPAQSLIADIYPAERRSGALGTFGLGSPVGAALGLALGGLCADALGWRWTLVLAGFPGVVIGLLVLFTIMDPRARDRTLAVARPPLAEALRVLLAQRAFVFLMLGVGFLSFVNVGAMAFSTSFFLRSHAAGLAAIGHPFGLGPTAVIGLGMGLFGALGGGTGTLVGGVLGDRLGPTNVRAYALIPALGSLLTVFGYFVMFAVPSAGLALVAFLLPAFFGNVWNGPGTVALQALAGPNHKATAMALVLLSSSVVGLCLGPITIGFISDTLAARLGSADALRTAILIGVTMGFVSAAFHWLASRDPKLEALQLQSPEPRYAG